MRFPFVAAKVRASTWRFPANSKRPTAHRTDCRVILSPRRKWSSRLPSNAARKSEGFPLRGKDVSPERGSGSL